MDEGHRLSERIRSHGAGHGAAELAAWVSGPEGAPVVVLVHGFPDTHALWAGVVAILERRFRVVTYDVRCAGASSVEPGRGDGAFDLEALSEDLAAIARRFGRSRPVHVVGHDWGAIQSWEPLADASMRSLFASLTVVSGPCLDHVAHWMRAGALSFDRLGAKLRQTAASWYVGLFQAPVAAAIVRRMVPKQAKQLGIVGDEPRPSLGEDAARATALYRANMRARLLSPRARRVDVPVLQLVPTEDAHVTPILSEAAEPWVTSLYRREIRGGHWVVRSHPERVASHVAEFVDHVERGSGAPALERSRVRPARARRGRFAGKLVAITGGASGIGRATALAFAEEGADVAIGDIDLEGAERTASDCARFGRAARAHRVDVGDAEAMAAWAAAVERALGVPDIVVNNAGIAVAGRFQRTTDAEWERLLRVNLWGVIHGSKLFAEKMIERGMRGHVVNVASAAAFMPSVALPAYATTKAAVVTLSECLRAELSDQSIGVSAICPGLIDTPITQAARFAGTSDAEQARLRAKAKRAYARRGVRAETVAAAVLRAVEKNLALVPVTIEAHAAHLGSRFAPGLMRAIAKVDPL